MFYLDYSNAKILYSKLVGGVGKALGTDWEMWQRLNYEQPFNID